MKAWMSAAFIMVGASALLLAAIGLVRFPDVLTRIQAATKAGTLGVGCLLVGAAVHFAQAAVTAHVVLILLFFVLTSPIAAHRIGRAAHRIGVPLWEGTHRDELRETVVPAASRAAGDAGRAAEGRGEAAGTGVLRAERFRRPPEDGTGAHVSDLHRPLGRGQSTDEWLGQEDGDGHTGQRHRD